jgi:hypothetical protein
MKIIGFISAILGMALMLGYYIIVFTIGVYFPQIGKYCNKKMELYLNLLAVLLMSAGTAMLLLSAHNN